MKTIRRIYFYAVAFISMEIVLWGMIGLLRSVFSDSVGGGVQQLAQALALILVGVPVFGIHWWTAQRSAKNDEEERESPVRTFFLYAILLGLLVPLTQNGLAFINRFLLDIFNIPTSRALIGGSQSLSDNLVAVLMNGFIAAYFLSILKEDWLEISNKAVLTLTRRVYRYVWVFYALIMAVIGVNQILCYIFSFANDNYLFANGLSLTLVGVPLWVWAWKSVQDSLRDSAERASLLRLGVLYFLSLSGVIVVLSATGIIINEFLQMFLENTFNFQDFIGATDEAFAVAIPLGAVWAYYGYWLKENLNTLPSAPRRAALNRFYYYILSLIGLVASFIGVSMLLYFVVDTTFGTNIWGGNLDMHLANSLATLIVAFPLWLKTWRPMQAESLALDEAGDRARRSVIRKIYLYLAIFAGVVGGMIAAVQLISLLLESALGGMPGDFKDDLLNALQMLILFGGLLAYHWHSLKRDGLIRRETLNEEAKQLTVLIFDADSETLLNQLAFLMDAEDVAINLILQNPAEPIPDADAVILPKSIAFAPPEMLKGWLRDFNGSKLIVASESDNWFRVENPRQIAKSLRQLAEGDAINLRAKSPGWMIAVYILAGMMVFQILFFLSIIAIDSL